MNVDAERVRLLLRAQRAATLQVHVRYVGMDGRDQNGEPVLGVGHVRDATGQRSGLWVEDPDGGELWSAHLYDRWAAERGAARALHDLAVWIERHALDGQPRSPEAARALSESSARTTVLT